MNDFGKLSQIDPMPGFLILEQIKDSQPLKIVLRPSTSAYIPCKVYFLETVGPKSVQGMYCTQLLFSQYFLQLCAGFNNKLKFVSYIFS